MPAKAFDTSDNHLLAALPAPDLERWRCCLEGIDLAAGQVLQEARQPVRHAYFPIGAVVSLQMQSSGGDCDEVALVGREGMVGVSTFTGSGWSTLRAVVQSPGRAFRLSAVRLRTELDVSTAVLRLLLQYMVAQDARVAQAVVCSRHHTLEQRLALRLLLGMACQQGNLLAMTHEQLAGWLGVRRESVSAEAFKLQKAGLIAYSRGRVVVLDRIGLERRSCDCLCTTKAGPRRPAPPATASEPIIWEAPARARRVGEQPLGAFRGTSP